MGLSDCQLCTYRPGVCSDSPRLAGAQGALAAARHQARNCYSGLPLSLRWGWGNGAFGSPCSHLDGNMPILRPHLLMRVSQGGRMSPQAHPLLGRSVEVPLELPEDALGSPPVGVSLPPEDPQRVSGARQPPTFPRRDICLQGLGQPAPPRGAPGRCWGSDPAMAKERHKGWGQDTPGFLERETVDINWPGAHLYLQCLLCNMWKGHS